MLTALVRALVFVICLGATAFAHADADHAAPGLLYSATVFQHHADSTTSVPLFHQTNLDLTGSRLSAADNQLVWDFPQLSAPRPQKKHSGQQRNYDPALANSSRMANLLRHDPEDVQPLYQLAIELPVEPAPCLVKGYRVDFSETLNWMLTINPPSSRISGWKESNLTFTAYQYPYLNA